MALTIEYLGHSGFLFDDGEHRVAVDPFLTGNPVATRKPLELACGSIVLTHGHGDHLGDTLAIAAANKATVYASHEVTEYLGEQGIERLEPGNTGGQIAAPFGWVAFTQAFHSSSHQGRYLGPAMGAVIHVGGVTVYHLGDTGIFSDLRLLGEIYRPLVACVPIGDRYTMGPRLGSMAAEMVGARYAIPIHHSTFPLLPGRVEDFTPKGVEVRAMRPGERWMIEDGA